MAAILNMLDLSSWYQIFTFLSCRHPVQISKRACDKSQNYHSVNWMKDDISRFTTKLVLQHSTSNSPARVGLKFGWKGTIVQTVGLRDRIQQERPLPNIPVVNLSDTFPGSISEDVQRAKLTQVHPWPCGFLPPEQKQGTRRRAISAFNSSFGRSVAGTNYM